MPPDHMVKMVQLFALLNRVPLCSAQWERLFNTCRIPGLESGKNSQFVHHRPASVYYAGHVSSVNFD